MKSRTSSPDVVLKKNIKNSTLLNSTDSMSILLINTAGAVLKKNTRKNFKISVMLELPF